jgi:hypothetical protein
MNGPNKLPPGVPTPEEAVAQVKKAADVGFAEFMRQPTTKLLVSMIPATEPPEVLRTLVEAAYLAGAELGCMEGSGQVVRAVLGFINDAERD